MLNGLVIGGLSSAGRCDLAATEKGLVGDRLAGPHVSLGSFWGCESPWYAGSPWTKSLIVVRPPRSCGFPGVAGKDPGTAEIIVMSGCSPVGGACMECSTV